MPNCTSCAVAPLTPHKAIITLSYMHDEICYKHTDQRMCMPVCVYGFVNKSAIHPLHTLALHHSVGEARLWPAASAAHALYTVPAGLRGRQMHDGPAISQLPQLH